MSLNRRGIVALVVSLLVGVLSAVVLPFHPIYAQGGNTLYLPLASNGQDASIIPNQYIVLLHEASASGLSAVDQANALAATYGGDIIYTYDSAILGFAATLSPQGAAAMQSDPAVALVEPDRVVNIQQEMPTVLQLGAPWGLDRIDQRSLPLDTEYSYVATGLGVHVYVIDTGIRTAHVEFAGRLGNSFTAIFDGRGIEDCNGHGTHVAGTLGGTTYGVAKLVTIHTVRTLNCTGSGNLSGVIAGVDWITANHIKPAVANMSLGAAVSPSSEVFEQAIQNSINQGVTYVVAAGNNGALACNFSPARVAQAITVGATTSADSRASYSNYGECLDLFAPGSSILSASHLGNGSAVCMSGTSMASPHVAGAAALYLQYNTNATPVQVAVALRDASVSNVVTNLGTGSPNRFLYTTNLQPDGGEVTVSPIPASSPTCPSPSPSPTPSPTPTPSPEPEGCIEVCGNGTFEAGNVAWTQSSLQGFQLICTKELCGAGLQPHGGKTLAWLGGGNSERSRLSQSLSIPAGKPATLSYWHWIESEDYCGHDFGYVQITVDNSLRLLKRYSLCNDNSTSGWVAESIDLSIYAGKTVQLEFYTSNDDSLISSLLIDDISVISGSNCTTVEPLDVSASAVKAPEIDAPQATRASDAPAGEIVWRR